MKFKKVKLVIFSPKESVEIILNILGKYGAGNIGDYSHCSFITYGEARFLPLNKSKPTAGTIGKIYKCTEARIETICEINIVKKIIKEIKKIHPYEEVGLDIYPLIEESEI